MRGLPRYEIVLFFVFVAAFLDIMLLHKLRERRITNAMLAEKGSQFRSLQYLEQEEKSHGRKTDETMQKTDLEGRFLEHMGPETNAAMASLQAEAQKQKYVLENWGIKMAATVQDHSSQALSNHAGNANSTLVSRHGSSNVSGAIESDIVRRKQNHNRSAELKIKEVINGVSKTGDASIGRSGIRDAHFSTGQASSSLDGVHAKEAKLDRISKKRPKNALGSPQKLVYGIGKKHFLIRANGRKWQILTRN